jgi:hypothetical protein
VKVNNFDFFGKIQYVRYRDRLGRFSKYSSKKLLTWEIFGKNLKAIEKSDKFERITKIQRKILESKRFEYPCDKIFSLHVSPSETIRQALTRVRTSNRLENFKRVDIEISGRIEKREIKPMRLQQVSLVYDLPKKYKAIEKGKRAGKHSTPVDNISYAIRDFLRKLGYAISPKKKRFYYKGRYKRFRSVDIRICGYK